MKVEVFADIRQSSISRRVWTGKLSALPQKDDPFVINSNFGAFYVRHVTICADRDRAIIHVWMNRDDLENFPEV